MKTDIAHEPRVTLAVPGVHRVQLGEDTIGYVLEAGPVFVSLLGRVYNTSFEIAQSRDMDRAVRLLLDARR